MNRFFLLVLFFLATISTYAMDFTIKGYIQGLNPGDTLYFKKVDFPNFQQSYGFEVIVKQPNEFSFEGEHQHTTLYHMVYKPIVGEVVESGAFSMPILIKDQETILSGKTDEIYYLAINGGLYDNELLQEVASLDKFLSSKRGELFRLQSQAHIQKDFKARNDYTSQIESFYSTHNLEYIKLDSLKQVFYQTFPSSDFTVLETLKNVSTSHYDVSTSRYKKMDDNAKESYYGRILKEQLDILRKLQPEEIAPNFELTAMNGTKINLKDLKGSYVLLYHWGICPGTFQVEQEIVDLQNKYEDEIVIIGITKKMSEIEEFESKISDKTTVMGMQIKPILQSMLAHPWLEVEKIDTNKEMLTNYPFSSLPSFVFISPEGKIISRGSHETFSKVKETLEYTPTVL